MSVSHDHVVVQPAGMREATQIDVTDCRRSRGAGVFVPGPQKLMQRCNEKIRADYVDEEPWPPAASLLDLVRCTVVMDDPYAIAVFVASALHALTPNALWGKRIGTILHDVLHGVGVQTFHQHL